MGVWEEKGVGGGGVGGKEEKWAGKVVWEDCGVGRKSGWRRLGMSEWRG